MDIATLFLTPASKIMSACKRFKDDEITILLSWLA